MPSSSRSIHEFVACRLLGFLGRDRRAVLRVLAPQAFLPPGPGVRGEYSTRSLTRASSVLVPDDWPQSLHALLYGLQALF